MDKVDLSHYLPLSAKWYQILVTLIDGERHGYAIIKDVEERTGGSVRLWPAMLYRTLRQMREEGLIEESDPGNPNDDPRRKYFCLQPLGKRLLLAESNRLRALADLVPADRPEGKSI